VRLNYREFWIDFFYILVDLIIIYIKIFYPDSSETFKCHLQKNIENNVVREPFVHSRCTMSFMSNCSGFNSVLGYCDHTSFPFFTLFDALTTLSLVLIIFKSVIWRV
jgi:hypothetical protein